MTAVRQPPGIRTTQAAFTLLEVVLAIVIAVGLLTAVLLFYRQAAILRGDILGRTEELSAVRLVMDRMASELRTLPASAGEGARLLQGDYRSLRIVRAAVPSRTSWRGGSLGRVAAAETDLIEVVYSLSSDTNAPGILREEQAHTRKAAVSTLLVADPEGSSTNLAVASSAPPLTESIRHLRFRYYDGSGWSDSWERPTPPLGVEISLGLEPPPEQDFVAGNADERMPPEEYPFEVYRRIVAIPTSPGRPAAADPDSGLFPEAPNP
jgi:type II secretory pathway component PulJ